MERQDVISKAYKLINEPIDPNLRCPVELADIVNYSESEPGTVVEYFASNAQDRAITDLVTVDANGEIAYVKVGLKTTTALTFVGISSKLETVLIDEIMNSKDQGALAAKKNGIIRGMDNEEIKRILALCTAVAGQEVTADSDDDLLDMIIKMKQKISDYSTDYILLLASDVMDKYESYDKDNVGSFNYKMEIEKEVAKLGIKKVVKVLGQSRFDASTASLITAGRAILIGRNSNLTEGRPIHFLRRKFSGEIAELSGAKEGAVRLINIANTPIPINAGNTNTLGYGVYGYESVIQVLTNYRATCWAQNLA